MDWPAISPVSHLHGTRNVCGSSRGIGCHSFTEGMLISPPVPSLSGLSDTSKSESIPLDNCKLDTQVPQGAGELLVAQHPKGTTDTVSLSVSTYIRHNLNHNQTLYGDGRDG